MNGALYLSEMHMSGGRNEYNPGASYGGGYCDAQCFSTNAWSDRSPEILRSKNRKIGILTNLLLQVQRHAQQQARWGML
jgi:hypothetical protein